MQICAFTHPCEITTTAVASYFGALSAAMKTFGLFISISSQSGLRGIFLVSFIHMLLCCLAGGLLQLFHLLSMVLKLYIDRF